MARLIYLLLRSPRLTGSSRTSRARSIGPPRMRRCWPPSTTSSARSALTSTAAGCTNPSSTGRRPAPALISRPGYGTSPSSGGSPRRSTTPGPRPRAPLAVNQHRDISRIAARQPRLPPQRRGQRVSHAAAGPARRDVVPIGDRSPVVPFRRSGPAGSRRKMADRETELPAPLCLDLLDAAERLP